MDSVDLRISSERAARKVCDPAAVLFEEFRRLKPFLDTLKVGFCVSRRKGGSRRARRKRLPYFTCCYDPGTLANVNIVAFYYPLITDWEMMEADGDQYRARIRSALREEMIHALQVLTAKARYERSCELGTRFEDAEAYYDNILGKVIQELAHRRHPALELAHHSLTRPPIQLEAMGALLMQALEVPIRWQISWRRYARHCHSSRPNPPTPRPTCWLRRS
jgi:hypothetical protein